MGAPRTLSLPLGLPGARILVYSGSLGDQLLCAGAWVLRTFARKIWFAARLLCAGTWVLRGVPFGSGYFCAQALGF